MSKEESYNGWRNYETWQVDLWLSNQEEQEWRFKKSSEDLEVGEVADTIRAFVEAFNPLDHDVSLYADLLNNALSNVDWDEVARSMME